MTRISPGETNAYVLAGRYQLARPVYTLYHGAAKAGRTDESIKVRIFVSARAFPSGTEAMQDEVESWRNVVRGIQQEMLALFTEDTDWRPAYSHCKVVVGFLQS